MRQTAPAAFGRLCVETPLNFFAIVNNFPAAFGRLCVETASRRIPAHCVYQPPSGGCVLKPFWVINHSSFSSPAAFGRLCVETLWTSLRCLPSRSAAFGRLCVETSKCAPKKASPSQPPSGGCVLKPYKSETDRPALSAAFGRLCVETK